MYKSNLLAGKLKPKKDKPKPGKPEKSDSENDENEHELSYYINDRVQLMKEVLKIIKPKKIKSMAPDCIKDLDIEEINSMLLEELLGISNKRLKYIFNGQNLGEDSSSTDPEEEKQPVDVISLDDVSDDDFVVEVDPDKTKKKRHLVKQELKVKKIKKEKADKVKKPKEGPLEEENLMSVLELLELQARARAIRSQLMLEANKKTPQSTETKTEHLQSDSDDSVIIEVPKNDEIVINSSDSETENTEEKANLGDKSDASQGTTANESETQKKKIVLIRDRFDKQKSSDGECSKTVSSKDSIVETKKEIDEKDKETQSEKEEMTKSESKNKSDDYAQQANTSQAPDEDEIILIVDQEEMDGIMGD